jgi:hypothetical protein
LLLRRPGLAAGAVLAIGAVAGVAGARSVSTGDHARFTRDNSITQRTGFWASSTGTNEVRIIIYPNRKVRVGDRFDLIGQTHALGRVEVVETTETLDSCPRYPYLTVRARLTEGKLDDGWGQMVAITPPSRSALKGKVAIRNYGGQELDGMPPPGSTNSLLYAVDSDGDDKWDLVRYMYTCADGIQANYYSGVGEGCVEDWSLSQGTWTQTQITRVLCR